MAEQDQDRAAIELLARGMVETSSPAELPLFRATADAYFADRGRTLDARGRSDEPLGFGVEAVATLLTPFALDLARRVLTCLTEKVGDAVAEAVAQRLRRRPVAAEASAPGRPAPLDAAQLGLLRQVAQEEAGRLQVPPDQAQRLADALVASIATRQ